MAVEARVENDEEGTLDLASGVWKIPISPGPGVNGSNAASIISKGSEGEDVVERLDVSDFVF